MINNQCINYTYVNSSSYSPISTVNRGRSVCADPQEFQDCVSREDLIHKVMAWAADNSYKYHKCSFTTFINPLHGYLNCIHFKNSKVNMKGIETQWVIDSSSDDNSYKYHKCSFTTFINPLHGYLNCIHFKNSKVNMKGIETQWVIDSSSDSMEHTIREAVYL